MKLKWKSSFNYKLIFKLHGSFLLVESFFLLISCFVALFYQEKEVYDFLVAFGVAFLVGTAGVFLGRNAPTTMGMREGSVIVTFTWILFSFVGVIPYWMSGNIPDFANAFFETISGFTTTGASILIDVEVQPYSILFWRSLTHWIGGLGIIVITMAILPIFGFTGVQIYSAEVTGPNKQKLHPKISGTAKRLLGIYIALTLLEILLLYFAGMSFFDAVCNSFSTVSTGGFSTKNASIGYWNSPTIEWIVIIFMIASGVNLALYYFLITGKLKKIFENEEFRYYLGILTVVSIIITITLVDISNLSFDSISEAFRNSLFTVSSLLSTTGFYTVDYSNWLPVTTILLLTLMIIGGSSGSTSGGIKVIRVLLVFKYCYYEFKRMVHPNAVFPVRFNGQIVKDQIITRLLAYVLLYAILAIAGSVILCMGGLSFGDAIGAMISCLGDVGPGLGKLGPIDNYSAIPVFCKWFLSFVMLVGRLDLFTVLLIFTPAFWKK